MKKNQQNILVFLILLIIFTIPVNAGEEIRYSWIDNETINSLNFTISKNNSVIVHQLITTISSGQSVYIVTDLNSAYYVYISVNRSSGIYNRTEIKDYRHGQLSPDCFLKRGGSKYGCIIGYGSYQLPNWIYKNSLTLFFWILAGSFGAMFASFGAILLTIIIILFWTIGWYSLTTGIINLIIGLVILTLISHLRTKEKE